MTTRAHFLEGVLCGGTKVTMISKTFYSHQGYSLFVAKLSNLIGIFKKLTIHLRYKITLNKTVDLGISLISLVVCRFQVILANKLVCEDIHSGDLEYTNAEKHLAVFRWQRICGADNVFLMSKY